MAVSSSGPTPRSRRASPVTPRSRTVGDGTRVGGSNKAVSGNVSKGNSLVAFRVTGTGHELEVQERRYGGSGQRLPPIHRRPVELRWRLGHVEQQRGLHVPCCRRWQLSGSLSGGLRLPEARAPANFSVPLGESCCGMRIADGRPGPRHGSWRRWWPSCGTGDEDLARRGEAREIAHPSLPLFGSSE